MRLKKTPPAKVKAITDLAKTGMGVSQISRRTNTPLRTVNKYTSRHRDEIEVGYAENVSRSRKQAVMMMMDRILEYQSELAGRPVEEESTYSIRGGMLALSQTYKNLCQAEPRKDVRVGSITLNVDRLREAAREAGYDEKTIREKLFPAAIFGETDQTKEE